MNRKVLVNNPARFIVLFIMEKIFVVLNKTIGVCWRKLFRPRQITFAESLRQARFLLHFWRFDSMGHRCGLGRRVRFSGYLEIHMRDRSAVFNDVTLAGKGRLEIGRNSTIGENSFVSTHSRITIGNDVMVAANCYIIDSSHTFNEIHRPIKEQGIEIDAIEIEDDVWIGAHVVILKGSKIGKGSVIGANSLVKGEIPAYSVAAGNPAKVINKRGLNVD
jgi:acetyltransferase-like isoleucine patch superfamily enzyme